MGTGIAGTGDWHPKLPNLARIAACCIAVKWRWLSMVKIDVQSMAVALGDVAIATGVVVGTSVASTLLTHVQGR